MSANPNMPFDELVNPLERATARTLPNINWDATEIIPTHPNNAPSAFTTLRHSNGMSTTHPHPVRLRTTDPIDELCHGYCEQTGEYHWYSNTDIEGSVTTPNRFIPDLPSDDDQENYWWVVTPTGIQIAFQSIDVEEVD